MATTSEDDLYYLSPGFDPSSLTIPKLRQILVSNDIPYSGAEKKPQLVELFNQKLVPRSRRILSAREKIRRTSAGIESVPSSQSTSGTGEEDDSVPSLPEPVPEPRARRSRSTRASTTETVEEPTSRKTTGRRRTTRTPAESDTPVTEPDTIRPTARTSRKSTVTPEVKVEEETAGLAEESPFSNENPFQSGSSPLAPAERKRKSTGRKSQQPVRQSTSGRRKTEGPTRVKQEDESDDHGATSTSNTYEVPVRSLAKPKTTITAKEEELADTIQAGEEFTEEEQHALIREGVLRGEVNVLGPRRGAYSSRKSSGALRTASLAIFTTLFVAYAVWWRKEKTEVGYCNVGKPATTLKDMQVPDWLDLLQPQCEPCPLHAYCYSDMEARCERGFVLQHHPLSLSGLIPLTPTCEPDGEKARKIKAVADRAVDELRERRAKFECGELSEDGKPAKTVEIVEPSLKAEVSSKRRRGMTDEEFEDLWVGAIGEITAREEVTSDQKGNTGILQLSSSSLARISIGCAIRRSVRVTVAKYRVHVGALVMIVLFLAYIRNYIRNLRSDGARVPGLVSMVLDRLATQAALYEEGYAPEAFMSLGQLRDDVLREEFSSQRRDKIWKKVQAIVERNANIRASVKEGRSGDISRQWEWIGSTDSVDESRLADRRRSGRHGPVSQDDTPDRGSSPPAPGSGVDSGRRKWDEGRPIY